MLRRDFLKMFGAGGIYYAASSAFSSFASTEAKIVTPTLDPKITLLLSDCHINGYLDKHPQHIRQTFCEIVAEIAKMERLPQRSVCLGDFSYLWGHKKDYVLARELLKPLTDLGVEFTVLLGNHDRRSVFLEVYPEYLKSTKIPGRVVSVVDAGAIDFIMLDGLVGADDRNMNDMGPGHGMFCKDQQDWLLAELPKWKKPVAVCSHWPLESLNVREEPFANLLAKSPNVFGYIYGHKHRWRQSMVKNDSGTKSVQTLCIPSAGYWGDIGYAIMRTEGDISEVTLTQKGFWYPKPNPNVKIWNMITRENNGLNCIFHLPKS